MRAILSPPDLCYLLHMVVCASCGRKVEGESTHCPSCGGLVTTQPLALHFARRYESMSRSERGAEWWRLATHEREEARRLLGGSVDIPARRSRVLALFAVSALAAAVAVGLLARGWTARAAPIGVNPLAGQSTSLTPPLLQPLSPPERIPQVCEGGLMLPEPVAVSEPTLLYAAPSRSSEAVVRLELNTLLVLRCRATEWARLEVQQPPRLRGSQGWVPVELVRELPDARAERVLRIRSLLSLTDDQRRHERKIAEAIVGIIADVPRCGVVDLGSVAMWQPEGGAPEFSVVCDPGETAFNYWFDLEGRESRPPAPLDVDGESSVDRCRAALVGKASRPESVLFDGAGAVEVEYPRGTRRLVTTASASDSEGRTLDYRVLCVFEDGALTHWAVADAGRQSTAPLG